VAAAAAPQQARVEIVRWARPAQAAAEHPGTVLAGAGRCFGRDRPQVDLCFGRDRAEREAAGRLPPGTGGQTGRRWRPKQSTTTKFTNVEVNF